MTAQESLQIVRQESKSIIAQLDPVASQLAERGGPALAAVLGAQDSAHRILEETLPFLKGADQVDPVPVPGPGPAGMAVSVPKGTVMPRPYPVAAPSPLLEVVRGKTFTGQQTPRVAKYYEDCIFDGMGAAYALLLNKQEGSFFNRCSVTNARKGILGNSFTFVNGHVYDCFEDGVNFDGDDFVFMNSYLAGFGTAIGAHADAFQCLLGRNGKILGNFCNVPGDVNHLSNACVLLKSDFGVIDNVEVRGNKFNGGLRHVQVRQKSTKVFPIPTNIKVDDNIHLEYAISLVDGIDLNASNDTSQARLVKVN